MKDFVNANLTKEKPIEVTQIKSHDGRLKGKYFERIAKEERKDLLQVSLDKV